jgi:hypothetical protein
LQASAGARLIEAGTRPPAGPARHWPILRTLVDAIVAAGGSGIGTMFFCSPGRRLTLVGYYPELAPQVFGSSAIASGTLIAVDPRSFASATGGDPEILASKQALVHYEDTNPQQIGTAGTPNVVAAPTRSAFQTDVILLRCILRITWALRVTGAAGSITTGLQW